MWRARQQQAGRAEERDGQNNQEGRAVVVAELGRDGRGDERGRRRPEDHRGQVEGTEPAPRRWAGAASDSPARSAGAQAVAARKPSSCTTNTRANAIGTNDTMKSAALMTMQTAGITTARSEEPVDPRVGDSPADERARDAAENGQRAERPVGRLLRQVQLVLVEVRHPGGDRGDDEADRRHADQRVAHRRDAQNRADVLAQPVGHVGQEMPRTPREEWGRVPAAASSISSVPARGPGPPTPVWARAAASRSTRSEGRGRARRRRRPASPGRGTAGRWPRRWPDPCPGRRSSGTAEWRRPCRGARSRSSRR